MATHRLAIIAIRWLGCVTILHPGLQQGPSNGLLPDGRLVHNTSPDICASLGSRSSPYSLCPNLTCVDRPHTKQSRRFSGLLEQTTMLIDVQPWSARAACHPRLRARSFATPHRTTQLFRLPFTRSIPLPPGLHGVQTETTHRTALTVRSGQVHSRHWASPTRSFVFSSVQPVRTEVCQTRLAAPALHPTYAPLKGRIRNAEQTRMPG